MKLKMLVLAAVAAGLVSADSSVKGTMAQPLLVCGAGRAFLVAPDGHVAWNKSGCGNIHRVWKHGEWVYYSNGDLRRIDILSGKDELLYRPCEKEGVFPFWQGRASLQALREGGRVRLRGAQERQRRGGRERHGLHRGAEGRHLGARGEVQGRPHGPRRYGPRRRAPPLPHDPQDGQGHVPRVLLERELRARRRASSSGSRRFPRSSPSTASAAPTATRSSPISTPSPSIRPTIRWCGSSSVRTPPS